MTQPDGASDGDLSRVLISRPIVRKMSTKTGGSDTPPPPGAVLFGKTRGRLLAWLYGHPDERFYLRQLVRQSGASHGAVPRELDLLLRAGLVTRTIEGRQVYFQADRESPIFSELQQLLLKTFGAADALRDALAPIASSIEIAFIYGSAAKGPVRASSDVDLLIVGTASLRDVVSALSRAQYRIGRDVNPSVYPREEFRKKIRAGHHFLTTVLHESKVFIIGSDNELARLAEVRLADTAPNQRPRGRGPARGRRA